MKEKIREIAQRIAELREIEGLSEQKISVMLGIEVDQYQAYESGQDDIPASVLLEIAQILNTDMTVLLTGESPRLNIFTVTRKGSGVNVERHKAYAYQHLADNFIHRKAEPFLVTVQPKPADMAPSMNTHPGQEFNFLLEGRLKVMIHNNEIILEPGDSVYFDSNYEHAMVALDGVSATFLAIIL